MTRVISFAVVSLVALFIVAASGAATQVCGKGKVSAYFSKKNGGPVRDHCSMGVGGELLKAAALVVGPIDACRPQGRSTGWTNKDGGVVLFDTHPTGYIEYFVPIGRQANGDVTKRISTPPRALKAVLETFSSAISHRYAKDLFISYPEGVVQLSLNSAKPITNASLNNLIRVVTAGYSSCIAK